ncbi:apolipoprotein A1/A4/E family protein [Pseudomonas entomophila]|uniref:apolipoprotein A1/A4/E family protein n=1 Tax=Pseudomonas entomophila TaxID=312306 RepID=UPI00200EC730|nr:apolipoprotein A1/A4/E family protein [Pseudomonas entomophila]
MDEQTHPLPPFALMPQALNAVPPDIPVVHRARKTCEDLRRTFNALLSQAPGVRQVIGAWLKETLDIDPKQVALLLETTQPPQPVDLVALTAWAQHHAAHPMIDLHARFTGKPGALPQPPSKLLERLAALNLSSLVRQRWSSYWGERAKGTPKSRKEQARAQYRRHFEATVDIAFASDPSAAELHPVLGVMDNPESLRLDNRQLFIETPTCEPGALIFSIEGEPALTLYSPGSSETLSHHASRQALESKLGGACGQIIYTSLSSIDEGFDTVFEHLENSLLATLGHDPGAGLGDAAAALALADRLHGEWRHPTVFAMPFALESTEDDDHPGRSLFELAPLGMEVPWSTRVRLVAQQLEKLAQLSPQDLEECQRQQGILLKARDAAQVQIDAILASAKWHSDARPVTAPPALVTAHSQALLAHARMKRLLGELTAGVLALVESLFKPHDDSVLTASAVLCSTPGDLAGSTREQALHEVVVIARRTPQDTPDTRQPFAIYWVGGPGGLLQCDDQAALADYLGQHGPELSLRIEPIVGDSLAHALDAQLAHARQAWQTLQNEKGLDAAAVELPQARQTLGLHLQVSWQGAREAALSHLKEEQQLASRLGSSPTAFAKMTEEVRTAFKTMATDYLAALRDSQALMDRDLPEREAFCQKWVSKTLRQDFDGFDGGRILLQLPLSTSWRNHPVVGSGAPGTPTRPVLTASLETEEVTLEGLLLQNIDSTMLERLNFVKPKRADGQPPGQSIEKGLDRKYLLGLAHRLDLAGRYESALHAAFSDPTESEYAHAYRRECLIAPHRLMLKLQNLLYHQRGDLDSVGHAILCVAIDADSRSAFQADGHDIQLLPAQLTAGGKDTDEQSTTLSGVTFIEDRASKVTLLYRPDHPTHGLRQYDSLEQARLALFDERDDYLVSRALSGNPGAHRTRLREARIRHFDRMIGVGTAWPATTSLAAHLLEAHRGRLVMEHRATSRSNLDLFFEHLAGQSAGVLIGFKIALGAIPFLGLPISAYDAFVSATEVVKALSKGSPSDVLQAINDLIVSLVDVAMDALGVGIGLNTASLRRAARMRRIRELSNGTVHLRENSLPQRSLDRFTGLEYEQPLSLEGLQPATHGKYRGIYRHTEGNFILVGKQTYKVSWDTTAHTWQLDGNTRHKWKRAIAQDEHGQWDTHFALYGVHRQGAGSGGGQALGRVADTLDPLWPAAIRERLPRWWRDHAYRQHNRLRDSITRDLQVLQPRANELNQQMKRALEQQGKLDAPLKASLKSTLADAERIHRDCQAFQQVAAGRIRKRAQDQANDLAILICNGRQRLSREASTQLTLAMDEVDHLKLRLQQKSVELTPDLDDKQFQIKTQQLSTLRANMNQARLNALAAVDDIREQVTHLRTWRKQVRQAGEHRDLLNTIDGTLSAFTDPVLNYMAVGQLTALLVKPGQALSGAGIRLQLLMKEPRATLDRALYALHQLGETKASAAQRVAIMTTSLQHSERFRHQLKYWLDSYATYIEPAAAQRLETSLTAYEAHFKGLLLNKTKPAPLSSRKGTQQPRVFETTDNRLLIGEPDQQSPNVYRITGVNGRTELYHQDRSGKFTLTNPDTAPTAGSGVSLKELRTEARRQLDELQAYRGKVQQHANQGMDGASLDDLMQFKATDLENLASRIAEQAHDDSLVQRLRDMARESTRHGKALRVGYIMGTHQPNGGQLDYLHEAGLVRIEKEGALVELRRTSDGRRDFLQEFVVLDTREASPRPLWYAHFHFDKANPSFEAFVKAHLKTIPQRRLGREWQDTHVEQIWRGELTRPIARKHFATLF